MSESSSRATASVRPIRKLFDKEWLEIVSLARNGTSIAKISTIYDVHHTAIYRGLKRRGVSVGSLASEANEEEMDRAREKMIQRIKDTKDKDFRFTEFLQQQIVSVIMVAQKQEKSIGSVMDDVRTLKIAIDGVRNATDNKWKLLGLDRENQDADAALPELPIREMTNFEVDAIRNKQVLEDGDLSPEDLEAAMDITDGIGMDIEDEDADPEPEVAF